MANVRTKQANVAARRRSAGSVPAAGNAARKIPEPASTRHLRLLLSPRPSETFYPRSRLLAATGIPPRFLYVAASDKNKLSRVTASNLSIVTILTFIPILWDATGRLGKGKLLVPLTTMPRSGQPDAEREIFRASGSMPLAGRPRSQPSIAGRRRSCAAIPPG